MASVSLKGYKVDKVDFIATLENGTQVKLGNKYQYNVQYAKNNMCKGEFDIEVYDSNNPDKFKVHVVLSGIFSFKDGEKKEIIHTDTFKALFPYVKAFVTTLTANCGIPPIMIPDIDIDNQQIYRIDNNPQ
ncbi:MAG: protein-export chaperone SecB [Eubacteriales bacterium]|nr:protein-export chaperone SecB [Eubacteriales bacterium]